MEQLKPFIINEKGSQYIIRIAPYGAGIIEKWNVNNTPYISGIVFGSVEEFKQLLQSAQQNGTFERFTEPELDYYQNIIGIGV